MVLEALRRTARPVPFALLREGGGAERRGEYSVRDGAAAATPWRRRARQNGSPAVSRRASCFVVWGSLRLGAAALQEKREAGQRERRRGGLGNGGPNPEKEICT